MTHIDPIICSVLRRQCTQLHNLLFTDVSGFGLRGLEFAGEGQVYVLVFVGERGKIFLTLLVKTR